MKTPQTLGIAILLAMATTVGAQTAGLDYTNGINDLAVTNLTAANINFSNAVHLAPTNAAYNVFYAMTELLTVPSQPAGSNFLTRLGFSKTGRNVYEWKAKPTKNSRGHLVIPTTTPPLSIDDFTAQLRTNVLSSIAAAQTNLAAVTDTNFSLDLTTNETHFSDVTLDWGDVQMLRSLCGTFELFIYTIHSWDLDVRLNTLSNYFGSEGSFEAFLTNYPDALTAVAPADLPAAQGVFTNAISNYLAASQFIRNRTPGETRLFNLDAGRVQEELEFRQTLSNLLASLNGPVALTTSPNNSVSAQAFFSGNFDPRAYLPQFQGAEFVWDTFPDTTLGGVVTGLTQQQFGKRFLKRFKTVLDLPGTSLSVFYNFTNFDSQTGVVQTPGGTLYGTLNTGGPYIASDMLAGMGFGSIFEVTTGGQFKILYNFGKQHDINGNPLDGAYPNALVLGSDGNLYGTTEMGGSNINFGTVFKITPSGQWTDLHSFTNDGEGLNPAAALVEGADGRFYGTTEWGGANNAGSVFAISTNGVFTNLYSFSGDSDGSNPAGAMLALGTNGQLYGTTPQGGLFGFGTLFSIDPSQPGQIDTLYNFGTQQDGFGNPLDGAVPNGVVQGADGNFYGTTQFGGANDDSIGLNDGFFAGASGDGTLFSFSPGTTNFTSLFSFDEIFSDGYNPIGALVPGPDGVFYGVTSAGGANQLGTVFSFTTNSSPTNLVWLDKTSGSYDSNLQDFISFQSSFFGSGFSPVPSLLTAGFDGNLYGTTTDNGNNGKGTIYKLNISNFPKLYTLTVNASPANGGSVTVNGANVGGVFTQGSSQVLMATASSNFKFIGWSGGDGATNNPLTVTMTTNLNITAIFLTNSVNSNTNLTLTLLTNGNGTVSPNPNGKHFTLGQSDTLTATALSGNLFSNWTGSIITNKNPLALKVESNMVLQANFVPNPFLQSQGTYNGLFSVAGGVTEQTAGMLKGLVVGSKGNYSGALAINGVSHTVSGSFDVAGQATNNITRTPALGGLLTLAMTLNWNNSPPQVTGTVTGTNWMATNLTADLATNTLPLAQYTMLMPPDANHAPPTNLPGGYGYALIANYPGTAKSPSSATAKITGALADGTTFSQGVPVSQDGYVPIYVSLYSNKGLLLGWINLDLANTNAVGATSLTWIHPKTTSGLYTNGFTNLLLTNQILLSRWTNAPTNIIGAKNLSFVNTINGDATLTNFTVTISNNFKMGTVSGPKTFSGSVASTTGLLTVSFGSGTSKITGYGAILLNSNIGGGYFVTKSNAQVIQLQGP